MHATDRRYLSEAEYLALEVPPGDRYELFDGELVVTPAPSVGHQRALGAVYVALRAWAVRAPGAFEVLLAPVDVRVGPDRILQPDIVVLDRRLPDATTLVTLVPVLAVEILSPSSVDHDRRTKRLAYAEAGVAEYWVVDPSGGAERFDGPGLTRREAVARQLTSATLPGLVVEVG